MSSLCHFPTFHSLLHHKLSSSFHCPLLNSHINYSYKAIYSTISASSSKKSPRACRKVKSDEDLRKDIREFLAAVGLPANHVPTTKELSQYGRQDLGNIVRRRGHKYIEQLLANASTANLELLSQDEPVAVELSTISLQEKISRFIQHGEELDSIESEVAHDSAFIRSQQKEAVLSSCGSSESENRTSYASMQEQTSSHANVNDKIQKVENEVESKRLKFLLHQKELELRQLKEQIEKEKHALSLLQTKAETEITRAQKLLSEKETELHDVEEALSGLTEVEIDYLGDGETVELAGSFNGWQHKVQMDLQLSSDDANSAESRTSRLWRAVMWLYPGVYEIKFVVDGDWRIDPQRESTHRNNVHNNILRVAEESVSSS